MINVCKYVYLYTDAREQTDYFASGKGAKYCDEYFCARSHNSKTTRPNLANF